MGIVRGQGNPPASPPPHELDGFEIVELRVTKLCRFCRSAVDGDRCGVCGAPS